MAGESLITEEVARSRWTRIPAAVRVGIIYFGARVITTILLVVAGQLSGFESRFGPQASIGDLILGWDARWYWIVAETGYPTTLPLTDGGAVAENAWAFMPLYAYLAKWVSLPFGGQWVVGAFIVSIVAGYAASFVLYRMMRQRMD